MQTKKNHLHGFFLENVWLSTKFDLRLQKNILKKHFGILSILLWVAIKKKLVLHFSCATHTIFKLILYDNYFFPKKRNIVCMKIVWFPFFHTLNVWNCMISFFGVWNCKISIFGFWRSARENIADTICSRASKGLRFGIFFPHGYNYFIELQRFIQIVCVLIVPKTLSNTSKQSHCIY